MSINLYKLIFQLGENLKIYKFFWNQSKREITNFFFLDDFAKSAVELDKDI